MDRVRGLDTIRAVCAYWVVMCHFGGPPLTAGIDRTNKIGWFIGGIYNNVFNGPAAVIVFFVISGFCIHFPFARGLQIPSLAGFLSRRYLRIGVPLAAALALAPILHVSMALFETSILWSLIAELIYYTLYPALLWVRRAGVAWSWMIVAGLLAAALLAATDPTAKEYPAFGFQLNWLLGLPCWLLGCELAERVTTGRLPKFGSIGWWRLGVWGVSIVLSVLRFHGPIGYPWTLNLFALLAAAWLVQEIRHFQTQEPSGWLEWAGKWSYSVYLFHVPAHGLFDLAHLPNLGTNLNWAALMVFVLAGSYVFYLCVEWPSHLLAQTVGRALSPRRPRPSSAGEPVPEPLPAEVSAPVAQ